MPSERPSKSTKRELIVDVVTMVVGCLTILMAGSMTWERMTRPGFRQGLTEDRYIDEWREIASEGNRIGPLDAGVTIIEFGDYECPFCRNMERALRGVLTEWPNDVAMVYRHFPLPMHRHAYRAARFAECAAEQGRFVEVHRLLYAAIELESLGPARIADLVDMPSAEDFGMCAERQDPMPRIEQDILAVDRLSLTGTPTLIVNGTQLASLPDSAGLAAMVRDLLQR